MGIVESRCFVYICVGVDGIYTCNTGILATRHCFYVCVGLEDMYTCKTGVFGKEPLW